MKQQTFEREITKWLNVSIRFEGVNATISVGSTPRLVVDISQVEELVVQDGPGGRPAIEIVSSGVPGELAIAEGDLAFSPLSELYEGLYDGIAVVDDGLPALIGWHDAYRYLDRLAEVHADGDEDTIFATVLRCLAYRWGALRAGVAIWETDVDFRLNDVDHELIDDFGQTNGTLALSDAGAISDGGRWVGTGLDLRLTNFRNLDLANCRLHGTFTGSDFRNANLRGAQFIGCDLTYCNFEGAELDGADFADSLITNARFSHPGTFRTKDSGGDVTFLGWRSNERRYRPDDESLRGSQSSGKRSRLLNRFRTAIGSVKHEPGPEYRFLPQGFPDLFGCSNHQTRAVELRRWNEPLSEDHAARMTIASGLTWTLAVDQDDFGKPVTIVDCTWASDGLQELGVDLAATPLVAIQTWNDIASLDAIANCGPCQERLKQLDQTLIAHWSDGDEPADAGKLPRFPRLKWTDPPAIIAEAVIDDLNKRSILGQSMTVLEGTAGWDLIPKVPIYVQFCLEIGGELLIEARRDFSYWDVVVDEQRAAIFSAAGFSIDGAHQFEMLLGPDPHNISHRDAIENAVRTAIEVFKPERGRIRVDRIEGVSHIEGERSAVDYARSQRRIDRLHWDQLLEAAERRIEKLGDGDRLFDMLQRVHPHFARLVSLAHLDEFFDRMDDLHVLIPADADAILSQMEGSPFTSPEEIATLVLRHCFRWSNQRTQHTINDSHDPDVLSIGTLANESFMGRLRNGELAEIEGLRVESNWNDACVNGSFAIVSGRLPPPEPPPLIVPTFD